MPDFRLVLAVAGYLAVVAFGIVGILAVADADSAPAIVSSWVTIAGAGGVVLPLLGKVGKVSEDTTALRNGELEAKVGDVVGHQLDQQTNTIREHAARVANTVADKATSRNDELIDAVRTIARAQAERDAEAINPTRRPKGEPRG